jgi:UDP-4-amino-4,6-dideoxy-N-acetyl-beta-L-altrosamine N-acetyltransferase
MIILRDVKPHDKDILRNWRNLPTVNKYLYTDHVISPEEHDRWFQGVFSDPSRRYWIINCDDEDVGVVYLYNIDNKNKRCYWAFYLASPNTRGKGIGSFVEYSILKHVFEDMNMQKLCAEVLTFNEPVTKMHKGFGFVEEGHFRKHIYKGGRFEDIVCVAMLKEEWEAKKTEIEERLMKKGVLSCPEVSG